MGLGRGLILDSFCIAVLPYSSHGEAHVHWGGSLPPALRGGRGNSSWPGWSEGMAEPHTPWAVGGTRTWTLQVPGRILSCPSAAGLFSHERPSF